MFRNSPEISGNFLEISRKFLEMSTKFLEISWNFLEISRKFVDGGGCMSVCRSVSLLSPSLSLPRTAGKAYGPAPKSLLG